MEKYTPLTLSIPQNSIRLIRTPDQNPTLLSLDTPALEIMTDFSRTPAISILAAIQAARARRDFERQLRDRGRADRYGKE